MSGGGSLRLRSVALLSALALIATVGGSAATATPAAAATAEPGIVELRQMVDAVGAWTSGLAEAGKLAEPIPLVGGSAGAALGFPDVVHEAVREKIATLDSYGDFSGPLSVDLLDGRSGTLTLSHDTTGLPSGGHRFGFALDLSRTQTDQPFRLRHDSPKVELSSTGGVSVASRLQMRFSVVAEPRPGGYATYLERTSAGSPGFSVDVDVKLPSSDPGLSASLGILGVSLMEDDSAVDASLHLSGSAQDPDADGRLYVTRPDGTDGELKDLAASAALWDVGFAPSGAGSIDAKLLVTATEDGAFKVPDVSGTVHITWPDVSTGSPSVAASGLDPLAAFQRLSPRDLADMLGQLVSLVNGAQRGPANSPLPFLSGTLADAVKGAEALSDFLTENVTQPSTTGTPVDPVRVGEPTFGSIQEMVSKLNGYMGSAQVPDAKITATVGTLADDRLPLRLVLTRESTGEVDLVKSDVAVSGSATYGPSTLTDSDGRTFAGELVGRRVTAGSAGGTVASVSGSTLTLSAPWVGGQPSDGTSYSVSGAEIDAGVVNFDNLLGTDGKKIANANGVQPTAKITPDYTATLRLALDLSAPRTGSACTGGGAGVACPYDRTNLDGSKVVVTEEPLPVDRLLVGTGYDLLTARFPLTAGVDVHAKAGFLRVKVGGTVKVCGRAAGETCSGTDSAPMLKVELKKKPGEGDYVPVAALFTSLIGTPAQIAERVGVMTNVRAHAAGSVTVPDAAQFLGSGGTAGFTATWADITTTAKPTVTPDDGLKKLLNFDFSNDPQALLGLVVRVLQLFDEQLQAGGGSGVLSHKVPLLDTSLSDLLAADEGGSGEAVTYTNGSSGTPAVEHTDLVDTSRTDERTFTTALIGRSVVVGTKVGVVLGVPNGTTLRLSRLDQPPAQGTPYTMRTEIADAISLITATPPDSVQELVKVLDARLSKNTPLSFSYNDALGSPHLVVEVDWKRLYSRSTPLVFDVGGKTMAGTTGDGTAEATVRADIDAGLAVPLEIPAGGLTALPLKVLDDSRVTLDAEATVDGTVRANLGPLALSLGKPGGTDAEKARAAAHYKLGLSKSGGTSATASSLTDFLSAAAVKVNDYSGGVDCGSGFTPGGELALCANLPLYVTSNDGSSWQPLFPDSADATKPDPTKGAVRLRLPKKGNDAATLFDPAGQVGDGNTRNRVEAPSAGDIGAAFASSLLDFGTMGDGLDAFLLLVQSSMNAASLEGKLPVVGADLQAGADFVGTLRSELAALFEQVNTENGGKLPTAGQVRTYLDTEFKKALNNAGADPRNFALAFTCVLRPSDVKAVVGTYPADNGADPPVPTPTKTYEYAVVAQGTANGTTVDGAIGATKTGTGALVLGGPSYNTVTWTASSNATGYKVLRRNGSAWDVLATVGKTTSYKDQGAPPVSTNYQPKSNQPHVDSCDSAEIYDIEGVVLRVDIGVGTVNAEQGCTGTGCRPTEIPLDPGLPGLTLKRADGSAGGVKGRLGWNIHLAVALDKADGFSVLTKDQGLPEIAVGISLDVPDPLTARLAFIDIDLSKADGATKPAFAAAFQVDLRSGDTDEGVCFTGAEGAACDANLNKKLTLGKLSGAQPYSDLVRPQLDLHLNVDWLLKAKPTAALPGVQARLVMTWNKVLTTGTVSGSQLDSELSIGFEDVQLDVGAFLNDVLSPAVQELKKVTGPVQPIIDTLYAPIPVLSDLSQAAGGPPVTLITLAKTFSTMSGGPDLSFVDTVAGVVTFVNNLPKPTSTSPVLIPIGRFSLTSSDAFTLAATPDSGPKQIRSTTLAPGDVKQQIDDNSTKPSLKTGVSATAGITFPFLDSPEQIFGLIMGGDVDLVEFDSGNLTLAFTWRQAFGPVYAPPPVFITMSGTASVTARIVAGFDTYGLRKFVEAPTGTTAVGILNGLYFKTVDKDGAPLPVITLYGEIAAGAAVSAVVITVGVEGGVALTVAFLWNDPDADGKFRLFEFGQVALRSPICLFQTSGRLSLFLRVYITLGVSPFSVSFSFTMANITLLDFNVKPNCDPPPPVLGGLSADGKTLVVFAGSLGTGGNRGDSAWSSTAADYGEEVVKVIQTHTYAADGTATSSGVKVQMLGVEDVWTDAGIERVVVDGRNYPHPMKVSFLGDGDQSKTGKGAEVVPSASFTLKAVVLGGSKDDVIKTGSGESRVDGGAGSDTLTVSDAGGTTYIAGGPDDDTITTGDADAVVAGDSALAAVTSFPAAQPLRLATNQGGGTRSVSGIVNWSALGAPSDAESGTDGNDRIAVGRGSNTVYGNGKDDAVGVAADSLLAGGPKAQINTIVLGTGSDTAKGGSGDDTIWTGLRTSQARGTAGADVDGDGGGDGSARNNVDTGTGDDTVFGGSGDDFVQSGSTKTQQAFVTGGRGNDVLLGRFGTDELFGGPGKDWVVAEPATVGGSDGTKVDALGTLVRDYDKTPLPAGTPSSSKLLVGGDGEDRVIGGDGSSVVFGDRYEAAGGVVQPCGTPMTTPDSAQPVEPTAGAPGRDHITGGAGLDKVKAGGDADLVRTFGSADLVCGQAGDDDIHAGDGADVVWGGSGNDVARGDVGADRLYGNNGDDQLYGLAHNDVLEGNGGSDRLYGAGGADLLVGGSRAAGTPDAGDQLYGDLENDVLIGDNSNAAGTYPADLGVAGPSGLGGNDRLYAGDGADSGYGGLLDDLVHGGKGDDHLEGNNGNDKVYGEGDEDEALGGSTELASPGVGRPDGDDSVEGGEGNDIVVGDNAVVSTSGTVSPLLAGRGFTAEHSITQVDLGQTPLAANSGEDFLRGGDGNDVLLGAGKRDQVHGDAGHDYLEGNAGDDVLLGGAGHDDVVGGGSVPQSPGIGQLDDGDYVDGGGEHDVVLGDNGRILLAGAAGYAVHPVTQGRGIPERGITLFDLTSATGDSPDPTHAGTDDIHGRLGNDVLLGQDQDDDLSGGAGDDYVEGGQGDDTLSGDAGTDDLVGGSMTPRSGAGASRVGQPDGIDTVHGGVGDDVVTGDNAIVWRVEAADVAFEPITHRTGMTRRALQLMDLGLSPTAGTSAGDRLHGDDGVDVLLAQAGDDVVKGGGDDDSLQGNQGSDLLEGGDGQDDLVGGGSAPESGNGENARGQNDADDFLHGGAGADLLLGDNAVVLRAPASTDSQMSALTDRLSMTRRSLTLLDLERSGSTYPTPVGNRSGGDQLSGSAGDDVLLGQDGDDALSGGAGDDWLEGNGGKDRVWGDRGLTDASIAPPVATVPAALTAHQSAEPSLSGPAGSDGQDDLIGGSSNLPGASATRTGRDGFRDGEDELYGDGAADFELGDNGTLFRDVVDGTYVRIEERYARADKGSAEAGGWAILRHALRLDVPATGSAPADGFSGDDRMEGNAGEDFMWGQSGDDTMHGNAGDDDMYGELGLDTMFGGEGQDAMLGDRGGIVTRYIEGDGSDPSDPAGFSVTLSTPPQETFVAFRPGALDRRFDLLREVAAHAFPDGRTDRFSPEEMRSPGDKVGATGSTDESPVNTGGGDRMRGGPGRDAMHGGFDRDLMNGDSGGDIVLGDRGSDVLWGGKGCDPEAAEVADRCPLVDGAPDLSARGPDDRFLDYLLGGYGGLEADGSGLPELLDFRPRGSTANEGVTCSPTLETLSAGSRRAVVTVDPCAWFEMTDTGDDSPTSAHQHHQGTDWLYGGWHRDVLEGDVARNGPNPGDRLIDWVGAYNLYNHCNAAYGGFNDVRQFSPDMQSFLQRMAYGLGAGEDLESVTTSGRSGFGELGLVDNADVKSNNGSAYPSTPGHFEDFSCAP